MTWIRGCGALVSCALGWGCATTGVNASSPDWESRRATMSAQPLAGRVLLPFGAPRAHKPELLPKGQALGLPRWDPTARGFVPPEVLTLAVVEDRGPVVKVRSLAPALRALECHTLTPHPDWDAVAVTFWVRRVDLVPVLREPVKQSFANETSVTLDPGTMLGAATYDVTGRWIAYAGGVRVPLAPPVDSRPPYSYGNVGLSFTPRPPRSAPARPWAWLPDRMVTRLGERTFARGDELLDSARLGRRVGERLEVVSRCASFSLEVVGFLLTRSQFTAPSVGQGPMSEVALLRRDLRGQQRAMWRRWDTPQPSGPPSPASWRQGEPLVWSDGSPAGGVVEPLALAGMPVEQIEGRTCVTLQLGIDAALCKEGP